MSGILSFLTSIPALLRLIKALNHQADLQVDDNINKKKEIKKNVDRLAKAIKEKDEKALNDVFNSI